MTNLTELRGFATNYLDATQQQDFGVMLEMGQAYRETFNPSTVLELLDEIEDLRSELIRPQKAKETQAIDHAQEAKNLLKRSDQSDHTQAALLVNQAQVHATLEIVRVFEDAFNMRRTHENQK